MAVASAIGRRESAVKPQNMAVAPAIERTTCPPKRLVRKIFGNCRQLDQRRHGGEDDGRYDFQRDAGERPRLIGCQQRRVGKGALRRARAVSPINPLAMLRGHGARR